VRILLITYIYDMKKEERKNISDFGTEKESKKFPYKKEVFLLVSSYTECQAEIFPLFSCF